MALGKNIFDIYREEFKLHSTRWQKVMLVEKRSVTHNSFIYTFALPDATSSLDLPLGRHIQLMFCDSLTGRQIVRNYTPISPLNAKSHFELLVKCYANGKMSQHLSNLPLQSKILIRGPAGKFNETADFGDSVLMIAGGSGITPMWQLIRHFYRDSAENQKKRVLKIHLIYANVSEDDILLRDEIEQVSAVCSQFSYYFVLNEKPYSEWKGGVGFVSKADIEAGVQKLSSNCKVLVCGPPLMVRVMADICKSMQLDYFCF